MTKTRSHLSHAIDTQIKAARRNRDYRQLASLTDSALRLDDDTVMPTLLRLSRFFNQQGQYESAVVTANHAAYLASPGTQVYRVSTAQLSLVAERAQQAGDVKTAAKALGHLVTYTKPNSDERTMTLLRLMDTADLAAGKLTQPDASAGMRRLSGGLLKLVCSTVLAHAQEDSSISRFAGSALSWAIAPVGANPFVVRYPQVREKIAAQTAGKSAQVRPVQPRLMAQ